MCVRCAGAAIKEEQPGVRTVCEEDLPVCVRHVLDAARASRPDSEVTCIAFRTIAGTQDAVRVGPSPHLVREWNARPARDRLRRKELLVLSVTITETTFDSVRKVTHVLVARNRRKQAVAPRPTS
jgi:hypothetical protein